MISAKHLSQLQNKIAIVSQVKNSMETKLGESFQLSEVRNKSELPQKQIKRELAVANNLPTQRTSSINAK